MKKIYLSFCNLILYVLCSSQVPSPNDIDNLVTQNDGKIAMVFQKTEPNTIEKIPGKRPKLVSTTYRFTQSRTLLSATFVAFSIGDTSLSIDYYFDSGKLIKAKILSSEVINSRIEESFYYHNGYVINDSVEVNGPYPPAYYLERATQLIRKLKRKPIEFPE